MKNSAAAPLKNRSETINRLRIYQVMVESFIAGTDHHAYGTGWGPTHHRGNIRGVIDALDYIKDLGMNALWLTPVFDSAGNDKLDATGYFCQNYFKVDPKFGTNADLKELIEKAHDREMFVFLDGVFGHHKNNAAITPTPDARRLLPSPCNVEDPFGDGIMGVDYNDPATVRFYQKVATFWIEELGIDGWRLDQAYQVHRQGENCWAKIVEPVRELCAARAKAGHVWGTLGFMLGEIWKGEAEIARYGFGREGYLGLDSCFDFPMRYRLMQVLATQELVTAESKRFYGKKTSLLDDGYKTHNAYPSHAHPALMISNHDLVRFGNLIKRCPLLGYGREHPDYWKRHELAFAFLTAYTGPITVYYGDELGCYIDGYEKEGDLGFKDDHVSRSAGKFEGESKGVLYRLSAAEEKLRHHVSKLMHLRAKHKSLWNGKRISIIAKGDLYADLKVDTNDQMLFAMNVSADKSLTLEFSSSLIKGWKLYDSLQLAIIEPRAGNYQIDIAPLTALFLEVK